MYRAYLAARYRSVQNAAIWRSYTADALKVIAENAAKSSGGSVLNRRYIDIITPRVKKERTEEEIISGIRKKITDMVDDSGGGAENELI